MWVQLGRSGLGDITIQPSDFLGQTGQPAATRYARPVPDLAANILKVLALAFAGLIAYESLTPSGAVPSVTHLDKVVHTLAYAVLGFILAGAWHRSSLVQICIITLSYGALLELGQGIMRLGRSASFADQLANSLGAVAAMLVWIVLVKLARRFDG